MKSTNYVTISMDYVTEILTKLRISEDMIRYTDPALLERLCPFSMELHGGVVTCLIAHYLSRLLLSQISELGLKYLEEVLRKRLLLIPPAPRDFPEFRIDDLNVRCRLVCWLEGHYFFECIDELRDLKFYFALRLITYGLAPISTASCSIAAALLIAKSRLSQT